MATKTAQTLDTLDAFIEEVTKSAAAHSEPDTQGGATTHPIKDVEDHTRDAVEGARSAENVKDNKEDQGPPGVDAQPEAKAGAAKAGAAKRAGGPGSEDQYNIGTNTAATGEDASTETASAKAGKKDPGSTHPARTDNDALDGAKYAADFARQLEGMSLLKLAEFVRECSDDLCADLVMSGVAGANTQNKTAGQSPTSPPQASPKTAGDNSNVDPELARQVGWQMAGLLTGTLDKSAADVLVVDALDGIIKDAEDDADRVAAWLTDYETAAAKAAADQKRAGEDGGGMMPPLPAGGDDKGGGGGGGPPPPHHGHGGGDGGGAGGGNDDAALQMIAEICHAQGIPLEELAQTLQGEAGGGGGGGPPGGPGGPGGGMMPPPGLGGPGMDGGGPPPPPPSPGGMQVAAADRGGTPNTHPTKQAIAQYINEVVGRSRAAKAAQAAHQ